jgi:hypothetical protein
MDGHGYAVLGPRRMQKTRVAAALVMDVKTGLEEGRNNMLWFERRYLHTDLFEETGEENY